MKKLLLLVLTMLFSFSLIASDELEEKPTRHLQAVDVNSMQQAKEIFLDKTVEMRSKKELSLEEISQIHVITYTLEKSVAYFVENLSGQQQDLAKEIAAVVEDIHIASENNRPEQLNVHIEEYFHLVDRFIFCF